MRSPFSTQLRRLIKRSQYPFDVPPRQALFDDDHSRFPVGRHQRLQAATSVCPQARPRGAAVRLGEEYYGRLPGQLSGGEKQRVALARAFAGRPTLVLCDEPLSALDVSVQAAIMNLLQELQREYGTAIVFISHDLSAVYQLCRSVAVMYLGQICETGPVEALFEPPYHPYTEALLSAVPIPDPTLERSEIRLTGSVPSALDPPAGCRFHTRCPRKIGPICEQQAPPCRVDTEGHRIYCHIDVEELRTVEPVFSTVE